MRKPAPHLRVARDPAVLREAMEARDLTWIELARMSACSKATIGLILKGQPCSTDIARLVARSLRRSLGDLFVPVSATRTSRVEASEEAA